MNGFERVLAGLAPVPPGCIVDRCLRLICDETGASGALLLRQVDSENAQAQFHFPSDGTLDDLTNTSIAWPARRSNELLVEENTGDPLFASWGAGSTATLPIPACRASAILLWRQPIVFSEELRDFLTAAALFLRVAVPSSFSLLDIQTECERASAILQSIPQGVVFLEQRGEHGWVNAEAARLLGLECGNTAPALISQAIRRMHGSDEPDPPDTAGETDSALVICHPEGRIISVTTRPASFRKVEGRLWLFKDITSQRRGEEDLRASENRYKQLFDNTPLPAWVYDRDTLAFLTVNQAAVTHYGYTREEFLGMTLRDIRPPEEQLKFAENVRAVGERQQKSGPWRHIKKDGTIFLVEITSHTVEIPGHRARLAVANDITERSLAEQQLREQEERWQLALRGSNDGLWDYDIANHDVYYSRRWKEMLGYQEHELANTPEAWEARVHPDDLPGVQARLADHLSRKAVFYVAEYRLRCYDGSYKWIMARGQAVYDEHGKPVRLVGSHTDITERKHSEQQLTRDALYDSLTGLLNRRYFLEELDRAILLADAQNFPLVLALCDIDHFKEVNDTYGHAGGDDVLSSFGQIMQMDRRPEDSIGRIGGDEFCFIFPRATLAESSSAVERSRKRLENTQFRGSDGSMFSVTATFGICAWQCGMTGRALLDSADRALYRAKGRGRNRSFLARV